MKQAIIFGAGAVGRGFMGQVLSEAGYRLVFVDTNAQLVQTLNESGLYTHVTVSSEGRQAAQIRNVQAIMAGDLPQVCAAFTEADIAVTSVGLAALPSVCASIGACLQDRIAMGMPPIDLIIAENVHDAPQLVRRLILDSTEGLTGGELDANLGLVASSIGRMIPVPKGDADLGLVEVEPYDFLPVDHRAARGALPETKHFVRDDQVPFSFYLDRKLFIHNMGHSMCAYLGQLLGDTYVWEAADRPDVRYFVRGAMIQAAVAVAQAHGQPIAPLLDHVDDLLYRFSNRSLGDTVARVGRDPLRKLAPDDRFRGALQLASNAHLQTGMLSLGVAAALKCALDMGELTQAGAAEMIEEIKSSLGPESARVFDDQCVAIGGGFDFQEQLHILDQQYNPPRIP